MANTRKDTPIVSVNIKDCDVQTFRAGGKGGQNQNKRDTGVRIRHRASGAVGESRDNRTQLANKRAAFRRMAESDVFQAWIRVQHAKATGAIEAAVDEAMRPENLDIEFYDPTEEGR